MTDQKPFVPKQNDDIEMVENSQDENLLKIPEEKLK
jgi:hypothetical protein